MQNDYKDGATMKKERMDKALEMLKVLKEIEYNKAAALISFNLGLSLTKAREYLRVLAVLGKIKVNDGKVKAK